MEDSAVYIDLVPLSSGDKYFLSTFTRITGSGGTVVGIQIISQDITEQKCNEVLLIRERERLEGILKGTNTGTWEWNVQTGETVFNERWAEIIGYTVEELNPVSIETWMKFCHPDDLKLSEELLNRHFCGEIDYYECEARMLHKNGDWIWVLDRGRVISWDLDGRPLVMMGTHQDINDRKQAEEALYASNQKLRLLTSLTRHDVINKLTAIQLLHNIASGESDPGKREDYFIKSRQAIEQLESIIKFTREYEDFGVVASRWQQVQSLIRNAALETDHPGILVDTTIPPDIQIFADPIIQKVFSTLIENAFRHAGYLTRIQFCCSKADHHIIIVCEDDGFGVPMEEKGYIFEHGYGNNTGLGLFFAREILAITGLSIRETGEPGKGARFEILVPDGKWRRENNG